MYQRIRQTALRSAADTAANDKLTGTGRGRSFEQHESATIVAYSGRDTGAKRSAPGRTRTFDLRIRNPLLYPAELRAQNTGKIAFADGLAFSSCYSTVNAVKQKNRQNTGKNVASKSFTMNRRYYARGVGERQRDLEDLGRHISASHRRSVSRSRRFRLNGRTSLFLWRQIRDWTRGRFQGGCELR